MIWVLPQQLSWIILSKGQIQNNNYIFATGHCNIPKKVLLYIYI